MLRLFDKIILPSILLYGSEIWGLSDIKTKFGNNNHLGMKEIVNIDPIHAKFCKQLLGANLSRRNKAALSELGRFPIICNILTRTTSYLIQRYIQTTNSTAKAAVVTNLKATTSNFAIVRKYISELHPWDEYIQASTSYKLKRPPENSKEFYTG